MATTKKTKNSKASSKSTSKVSQKSATTRSKAAGAIGRPKKSTPASKRGVASKPAKGLLFAIVVIAVLLVGGTFGYAQYRAMQPEGILKQALARSLQAESVAVDFQMINSSPNKANGVWKMAGTVVNQGQFDLTGSYQRSDKTVGIDIKSVDGTDAYLRLKGLSGLPELLGKDAALYGITPQRNAIAGLENRWLVVPSDIKNTVIQNRPAGNGSSLSLSADDKKTLARLYGSNEFLQVSKSLADDTVDDVESFHYQVTVDSARLESFMKAVQKDISRLKLTDPQVKSITGTLVSVSPIDVWVSKSGKQFTKIAYASTNGTATDAIELKLSRYNQQTSIERPSQSTPLLEALTTINL